MWKKSKQWDSSSSPSQSSLLISRNSSKNTFSSEKKSRTNRHRCGNTPFSKRLLDEASSLTSSWMSSKEPDTQSLFTSGGSTYDPTLSRLRRQPDEEFENDSEEELLEMRDFVRKNRNVMERTSRRIDAFRSNSEMAENEQMQQIPNGDDGDPNPFRNGTIILLLLVLIIGGLLWIGDAEKTEQCLERFDNAKCSVENPVGKICNDLIDCYMREKAKRMYDEEDRQNGQNGSKSANSSKSSEKEESSLLGELFTSIVASAVGTYLVGFQRVLRFFHLLLEIINRIIVSILQRRAARRP